MKIFQGILTCSLLMSMCNFALPAFAQFAPGIFTLSDERAVSPEEALVAYTELRDIEDVRRLLDAGVDPNVGRRDCLGLYEPSAVHCAVHIGEEAIVRLLIEYGADVNRVGIECGSPLQSALRYGHEEIADMIIDAPNFNANNESCGRESFLYFAIRYGNYRIIKRLLDKGANVDTLSTRYRRAMEAIIRAYETTVVARPLR